jgi:hypothetical protein
MTARQLLRIGIALAIALFLWGLSEILSGGSDVIERAVLIRAVSETEIDTITFARPADTVRLVRAANGRWTVNGHAVSPAAVGELVQLLAEPVLGNLVAQNRSSHARMGVDSAGKLVRIARGDEALAEVILGEPGRAFRSVYARRVGDDPVFVLEGPLVALVDRSVTDWRDKRIAAVEPDSVAQVLIMRDGERYALHRSDRAWRFADGGEVDSAAVQRILSELRDLSAQGTAFATPEQADSADLGQPDREVTLLGMRGDTLTALAFDSIDGGYWVRPVGGETLYRLHDWKVNVLTPADSTLRNRESSPG